MHFIAGAILTTIYTKFALFGANLMHLFIKEVGAGTAPSTGAFWDDFSEQH